MRTSKERVRRLMREASLQASLPHQRRRGDRSHSGTICTNMPDMMWGTDATSCLTVEGNATIFVVVDHCTRECLGIHAASRGTRFEALEALRQAIHHSFGIFNQDIAKDQLSLRHDHGNQFVSHDYQNELKFLGIKSTPAYVAEPQCNGVSERFIRTLKEQLLWLRKFSSIQELNEALHRFKELFNSSWLVAKHNYLTPSQARAKLTQTPYPMEPLSVAS